MKILRPNKESFALLIKEKPRNIFICSPWISTEGVTMLKETILSRDLSELESFEIWFRITFDDFVFNRTDYRGLTEFCQQLNNICEPNKLSIRHNEKLHAKIYKCDESYFIGSANLTRGGFVNNIEILLEDRENYEYIMESINNLKKEMFYITLEYLEDFIGRCEQEDITKLKMKVKSLDSNLSEIKIPISPNKVPPHYRIPW